MDSIEHKIETLCASIIKTDQEEWDSRNKSLQQIIDIVISYANEPAHTINEAFTPNVFRYLKEPIKNMVRLLEM